MACTNVTLHLKVFPLLIRYFNSKVICSEIICIVIIVPSGLTANVACFQLQTLKYCP